MQQIAHFEFQIYYDDSEFSMDEITERVKQVLVENVGRFTKKDVKVFSNNGYYVDMSKLEKFNG